VYLNAPTKQFKI